MPPKNSSRKKKASSATTRLKELDKVAEAEKAQHLKAPNTSKKYQQCVAAAHKWLQGHFDPVQGEKTASHQPQDTRFEPDMDPTDAFVHPDFRKAFDRIPNQFSAKAVALYLTYQCFHQGKKAGTGASSRAAFKHFWEQSYVKLYSVQEIYLLIAKFRAGSTYRGKWELNPVTKEWQGNPVESVDVSDVMTAIKHKTSAEGGDRNHSIAMSVHFMSKMWEWSKTQCNISAPIKSVEERALKTKHLGFETFAKLAWQLWARCGEVCKIKRKDITFNCVNEKAYGLLYHRVHLRERKGWQRKLSKTEREADPHSHVYHIYDTPDLPACNAFQALNQWVEHLEQDHGRKLEPDDYLFPAMGANGIINPGEPISHDMVQKHIHEFTVGAGIAQGTVCAFSTHCFRRGSAQYYFMFARVGKRWHLRKVRWWGGWAEGEHRDTLIRYLLDELHSYEENYCDAMCPIQDEIDESYMGENFEASQPVTNEAMQLMHTSFTHQVKSLEENIGRQIQVTIEKAVINQMNCVAPLRDQFQGMCLSASTPASGPPTTAYLPQGASLGSTQFGSVAPAGPNSSPHAVSPAILPRAQAPIQAQQQPLPSPPVPSRMKARPLPTVPGLHISRIPVKLNATTRAPVEESWRWIVKHWREGDPDRGLHVLLKDWNPEWLQGDNKPLFGSKHHQRAVIATEFLNHYQEDEAAFLAAYPEAANGHSGLFDAIQLARKERGEVKSRNRRKAASATDE